MVNYYNKNKIKINKVAVVLTILLFILIFKNLFILLMPFIFGYTIANSLRGLLFVLEKKIKINRSISATICILIFLVIFAGIIYVGYYFLKPPIIKWSKNAPTIIENFKVIFETFKVMINNQSYIPEFIKNMLNISIESINLALMSMGKIIAKSVVFSAPKIFIIFVISIISGFLFLNDKKNIDRAFEKHTPFFIKDAYKTLKKSINFALLGYIKAQSILMVITFFISVIGLYFIGFEYFILISMIIGFIDALPMFGSGFILYPWTIYMFFIGYTKDSVYLIILYLTIFITRQILEPKILGKQIGIHPLITLMSIYIGFSILGVLGLILGPVTAIVIKAIVIEK